MVRRNSYCRIVCCTWSTRVLCSDLTRASALLPQTATGDFGQLKAWLSSKTLNSRGRPEMSGKAATGGQVDVGTRVQSGQAGRTDGKGRRAESSQAACASRLVKRPSQAERGAFGGQHSWLIERKLVQRP